MKTIKPLKRSSFLLLGFVLLIAPSAHTLILDSYPNAQAAYSLRILSSSYAGPAIEVRRTSDNQVKDIYFTADGVLDTADLISFVGSSDGEVTKWYSQLSGHPPLVPDKGLLPPLIIESGTLVTAPNGKPRLKFARDDGLRNVDPLPVLIEGENITVHLLMETNPVYDSGLPGIFQVAKYEWPGKSFTIAGGGITRLWMVYASGLGDAFSGAITTKWAIGTWSFSRTTAELYQNHELVTETENVELTRDILDDQYIILGADARNYNGTWDGFVGELVIYPYIGKIADIRGRTDDMNSYWETGPKDYNRNAQLPQKYDFQVTLYDWLETITIPDVTLPPGNLKWDGTYSDMDDLGDIWLFFAPYKAASYSRVMRQEPRHLVLNDGNGAGIEAIPGEIRILHRGDGALQPSWGNEPAYWYEVNLPMADGSNGNPYYKQRALCMRAMVITAVDMLMYNDAIDGAGGFTWNDMHGKALLSWADALYACKDEFQSTPEIIDAFEAGFKHHMNKSIATGIRDANTNMDMFPVEAAARIAKYSTNPDIRDTALKLAKRLLLGYTDGVLGSHHDVDAGAYFPAGYIGENDMADGFYNGESFSHLSGAWSYAHDLPGWEWLGKVMSQMSKWRIYQAFPYPDRPFQYDGGAGYSGRTGASALMGQNSVDWRDITAADLLVDARPLVRGFNNNRNQIPESAYLMTTGINRTIDKINESIGVPYPNPIPKWGGWSPWPKNYPYKPPEGWYTRLTTLLENNDPTIVLPIDRPDYTYSVALGGPPTGKEFWSYRNNHEGRDFGWFVEGDAQQGTYGGWYGGKVETFWIRDMGPVLISRHGKSGCNADDKEDSTCWDMVDKWGTTHVWGKDENGIAFSQVHEKGRELTRTAVYTPEENPVSVEVTTHLNDPNRQKRGEQSDEAIEGELTIINRFEAISNGLLVSHTVKTNRADQAKELYASIPVFLGSRPEQENPSIEYWDGSGYQPMSTELKTTLRIRIGRTSETYGLKYAYINFYTPQSVRLSNEEYHDPYQTQTRLRNILIDLHGSPGVAKTIPSEVSVMYGLNTTDTPGKRIMVAWAGPDKAIPFQPEYTLTGGAYLGGTLVSAADVQFQWEFVDGPSEVSILDPFSGETNVSFPEPGTYIFKLSVTYEGTTSVDYLELTLLAAQPQNFVPRFINMFNPNQGPLEIPYIMGSPGGVEIRIYNQLNEIVTTLINTSKPAGDYSVQWDGRNAASGVYKIWFKLAGDEIIKKCVLIK